MGILARRFHRTCWPIAVAWLLACQAAWAAPGDALKPALSGGWTRSGAVRSFDKDTLFDLVDGEAEAYFPYGFQTATSANYTKGADGGKEANVEIYEMGSLLDAYGIYSSMRDAGSKPIDVGTDGFGGTTQVMFYAGRYFVKAQVYSASAKGELPGFAKAVAAELPNDKKRPAELALVAVSGLVPRSDQYIGESLLGYACFPKGMLAEVKLAKAPAAAPARVFVVITASPAQAAAALDKYLQEVIGRGTKIKPVDDGEKSHYPQRRHAGRRGRQPGRKVSGRRGQSERPANRGPSPVATASAQAQPPSKPRRS